MSEADLSSMGGSHVMGAHAPGALEESPYRMPSKKLVMWLFIMSDAVTFAALLFAYGYLRNATPGWPRPFQFSPTVINAMLMTFVLVTSGFTVLIAMRAANLGDKAGAVRW